MCRSPPAVAYRGCCKTKLERLQGLSYKFKAMSDACLTCVRHGLLRISGRCLTRIELKVVRQSKYASVVLQTGKSGNGDVLRSLDGKALKPDCQFLMAALPGVVGWRFSLVILRVRIGAVLHERLRKVPAIGGGR